MEPQTLTTVAFIAALACAALWMFVRHRGEQRVKRQRTEFARLVDGIEHHRGDGTRPRFGYFPRESRETHAPPFHYTVEFVRGGYNVVVFEEERDRKDPGDHHRRRPSFWTYAELAIPECPRLLLGAKHHVMGDLRARTQVVSGLPGEQEGLFVACPDEAFARAAVTELLASTLIRRGPRPEFIPSVTLEHGTIRTFVSSSIGGNRFSAQQTFDKVDFLIDVVRSIPRDAWPQQHPPQA